jgi:hypothetical protein
VNCAAPLFEPRSVEVDTAMVLPASMVNIRMPLESSLLCPRQSSEFWPILA